MNVLINHTYLYTSIWAFVKLRMNKITLESEKNVSNSHYYPNHNQDFIENSLNLFYNFGIRTVFAIPGAHIEHFILAIAKDNRFKLIIAAHEEGAGFMADGYYRKSHQVPIAATINGPGATNLLTAVSTAQVDHSSILFLTGDTAYSLNDKLGFQTSSQLNSYTNQLFNSIVDKQIIPLNFDDLYQGLNNYFQDYQSNINYPMHINLHNDISKTRNIECKEFIYNPIQVKVLNDTFNLSKSVIVLGEDYNLDEIKRVVSACTKLNVPMVCTLGAKDLQAIIPPHLFCGVYGYAGHESAINCVSSDEVKRVYFFNTELNERNTMAWSSQLFREDREIFVISNDCIEHGIHEFKIQTHIGSLDSFIQSCHNNSINDNWFKDYLYKPTSLESNPSHCLNMPSVVQIMNKLIHKSNNFFLDSGDHRIYGSLYWDVQESNTFFTASKTAPMGWAIAAGIGASFVDNSNTTWVLTGDGCMLMHGNEISVAQRYQRDIKFIVINNGSYGRIEYRLLKEEVTIKDKISRLPYSSWVQYANSFNIQAVRVHTNQELMDSIQTAQNYNGPYLIEVMMNIENGCDIKSIFSSTATNFKSFWNMEKTNE